MELSSFKDIAQITFYGVISVISILTYRQARKTFFAPLHTELFKTRIDTYSQIIEALSGGEDSAAIENFDVRKVYRINELVLWRHYISTFFPEYIVDDDEFRSLAVGGLALTSSLPELSKTGYTGVIIDYTSESVPEEPALRLARWQSYEYKTVFYTEQYESAINRLESFVANPFLPIELRNSIEAYARAIELNVGRIRETLTLKAQELPNVIKNVEGDHVGHAAFAFWNDYRDQWVTVDKLASRIVTKIETSVEFKT